jgi:hypothetical protein
MDRDVHQAVATTHKVPLAVLIRATAGAIAVSPVEVTEGEVGGGVDGAVSKIKAACSALLKISSALAALQPSLTSNYFPVKHMYCILHIYIITRNKQFE